MKERWTVNKVLLAGRLTRDPEMRALASGKHVTQFSVATTEYAGNGKERGEFHNVVTWDRLDEVCGRYLGKGQQVAIEGRLQTRTWDDEKGLPQYQVHPLPRRRWADRNPSPRVAKVGGGRPYALTDDRVPKLRLSERGGRQVLP
jgi:hypothetical protein